MGLPGVPMALAVSSPEQTGEGGTGHSTWEDTLPGTSPQPAWDRILHPLCSEQGRHPTQPAKRSCCPPFLQEMGEETGGVQGTGNIPSMSSAPKPCHLSRQFFVQALWEQLGLLSQTAGCRSAEGMNAPAYGSHLLPQQGEVATRNQPVAQQHRQKQCLGTQASASLGKGVGAPLPIQGTAQREGVAGHPQAPCGCHSHGDKVPV